MLTEFLIRCYRAIPFRPKCRCGHPDGSCSERCLRLAQAARGKGWRVGLATVMVIAAAAGGCGSNNTNGNGNPPCMPNQPLPNGCPTGQS